MGTSVSQAAERQPGRVLLSWSGGKDSALALYELRAADREVAALVTTITGEYERVSMHGVRRALLVRQAAAVGIPLEEVVIPPKASNEQYESALGGVLLRWKERGVDTTAFGDLFLEDVRRYREAFLAGRGLRGLYPIWKHDTAATARRFVALGFRAIVVCVDPRALEPRFAGRWIDERFLDELPPSVDPCGENGEFHTFVADGPGFRMPVAVRAGETVTRDGFAYVDLLPEEARDP